MKKNKIHSEIELSIVIPSLNEHLTIEKFIDWCNEGIKKANIRAEIIIIDSSNDQTAELAKSKGATVIKTPKRGLGRAYIDAIPFIKGKYILMGDCDLTYDFRDITGFVSSFQNGYEYVMGSRFRGYIEPGSMPLLHRYFGTPLTTLILNIIYKTSFTDIHCGMRGITLNALKKINLESQGWEYASELVIKSARYKLKTTEVPVRFYKDIDGRLSHLKRGGFLTPWIAAWDNLRVMFIYTPDSFMLKPSYLFFCLSILLLFNFFHPLVYVSGSSDLILALMILLISFFLFFFGIFFRCLHSLRDGIELKIVNYITYNKGMMISAILFFASILLLANHFIYFITPNVHFVVPVFLFFTSLLMFVFTVGLDLIRKINNAKF